MTAPSPRLRTAWRVGSALAAAAGSAVVTSALVNRSRSRSRRNPSTPADAAPEPTALATPAEPAGPVDGPAATGGIAEPTAPGPAAGGELLVHDPAPAGPPDAAPAAPTRGRSDELARAIEAADKVEAAPAAWARAASDPRAQAADPGDPGRGLTATGLPALGEMRVPPGPPTPAVGTAAALAAETPVIDGAPAWNHGLPDLDTQVPRRTGQDGRRPPRRRHRTGAEDLAAAAGGTVAPPAPPGGQPHDGSARTVTGAPPPPAAAPGHPNLRSGGDDRTRPGPGPSPRPGGPGIGGTGRPEPSGPAAPAGPSGDVTPDRHLLLFVAVAVAVALVLGLGVVVLGGGSDDGPGSADTTSTADSDSETGGTTGGQPATTPVAQLTPAQAFAQAGQRLEAAGTFAYEGTSSATDVSPVRPGPWMGVDLTVDGQVQLAPFRLIERGIAGDGTAGETVTDGVTIWSRTAPGAEALAEQSLQTLYTLPDPTPARVGALLLPQWLTSATGATGTGTDDQGRRTFRATLPASVLGSIEDDRDPVDAVIVLTLDQQGDPAHLEVTTGAAGPPLRLIYDLTSLGDAVQIPIPGETSGTQGTGTGQTTTTPATP